MKITLIYPPECSIPTVPYPSCAVLSPCLEQAGHEVEVRDLNMELFYSLMNREKLLYYFDDLKNRIDFLNKKKKLTEDEVEELWMVKRLLAVPKSILDDISFAIAVMKDPDKIYNANSFNRALDVLVAVNKFIFDACPTPFKETYSIDRVLAIFKSQMADPMIDALNDGVIDTILQGEPDLIAVSLTYDAGIIQALKMLKLLKERRPDIPVVVGGAGIEGPAFRLIDEPRFFEFYDYVIVEEGDVALPEFATALENKQDLNHIPNLCYLAPDGTIHKNERHVIQDLDSLPTPDYSKLKMDNYLFPFPVAVLETSRGCYWSNCAFCSEEWRRNFRMRKPQLVLEDMISIQESTGIKHFQMLDVLAPPKTLKYIAEQIKERGLEIDWGAEVRFDKVYTKPGFIKALSEGGGTFFSFGLESGVERILDLMHKGIELEVIDKILYEMRKNKMHAGVTWFIGFPQEEEIEADTTYDFIATRRDSISVSGFIGVFAMGPGTILYRDPESFKIKVLEDKAGNLDYCYLDGSPHYDPQERRYAFVSRSDIRLLRSNFYSMFGNKQTEDTVKITGQYRLGPVLRHLNKTRIADITLKRTSESYFSEFSNHPDHSTDTDKTVFVYQIMTGDTFEVPQVAVNMFDQLDEPTTFSELKQKIGIEESILIDMVDKAINRGLIRIVCRDDEISYLEGEGA